MKIIYVYAHTYVILWKEHRDRICKQESQGMSVCVVDCPMHGGEQYAGGHVDTSQVNTEDASGRIWKKNIQGLPLGQSWGKLFLFTLCSDYAWVFMPRAWVSSGLFHTCFRHMHTCICTHTILMFKEKNMNSLFLRLVIKNTSCRAGRFGVVLVSPVLGISPWENGTVETPVFLDEIGGQELTFKGC